MQASKSQTLLFHKTFTFMMKMNMHRSVLSLSYLKELRISLTSVLSTMIHTMLLFRLNQIKKDVQYLDILPNHYLLLKAKKFLKLLRLRTRSSTELEVFR